MVTEEMVMAALNRCHDPEIPIVSIVELGLIYDVKVDDGNVHVKMTLTAPGCPMHSVIAQDARSKIESIDGVTSSHVEVVWDPPWTPERLTESARKKLGYA